MAEEAPRAATMAVHVQGGLGVSAEAASAAYLLRARGWALAGGDPAASRQADRRDRRGAKPAKAVRTEGRQWISHASNCPTMIRHSRPSCAAFSPTLVTDEVIRRDRETGENFDEGVHLALGAAGYLAADFKTETDGGFTRCAAGSGTSRSAARTRPWFHWGTTAMVAHTVVQFATPELRDEVLPGVLVRRDPAVPGLHRTRGRLGRRHLQDPGGARRRRLDHQRLQDVHLERAQRAVRLPDHQHRPRRAQAQEPDDVPGAAGPARRRDPGHPHRRRRPHQHHLLQRRARRRPVPHRRGQRRLGGAARGAGCRARHRRTRRQRTATRSPS